VSVLVGCTSESAGDEGPLVVATHSILGDLVDGVLGDEATVEVVMPRGADPHEFSPSAADAAMINEADLVVTNGFDFEVGLTDVLEAAADEGVPLLELGPGLDPLPLRTGDGEDPHWFTDPLRMARAAGLVAEASSDLEGIDADVVVAQAEAYAIATRELDEVVVSTLAVVPDDQRVLVTNHEVFAYFADRYGFAVAGVVVPSGTTLAEPSSGELGDLVEVIEATGVPAIFADTSASTELATVLAEETGEDIEVVALYTESLGEEGSPAETYAGLIETDAELIAEALT
jgi:zinc/manganese transport system substrate-binding protein